MAKVVLIKAHLEEEAKVMGGYFTLSPGAVVSSLCKKFCEEEGVE